LTIEGLLVEEDLLLELTADIVAAHVGHNNVAVNDVANLVHQVHGALAKVGAQAEKAATEPKTPVVSINASLKPDYIACMECGKKQKMLKRHLMTAHQMTPDQYRKDYGLPASYPMVAADYSERRRGLANAIGLGRRKEGAEAARKKPGRKKTDADA
jgi:predicted transcriptional regulator